MLTPGRDRALQFSRNKDTAQIKVPAHWIASTHPETLREVFRDGLGAPTTRLETPPAGNIAEGRRPARVLLFENLFVDPDRPAADQPRSMSGGTFLLASALKAGGSTPVIVRGRLDPERGLDDTVELEHALDEGVDVVAITLLEACLLATNSLVDLIHRRSSAPVIVGGPMPTHAPVHVAAHAPCVTGIVRGAGEAILPALARLMTGPLDAGAAEQILGLDGVLVIHADQLLAGHPARTNDPDPDETRMDFDLLGPEHIGGGLSIETSRGCTNPCLFCTTMSRQAHRGRSPHVVRKHLDAYRGRLEALYGTAIPGSTRRVQICDDDFTCDPARAAAVLRAFCGCGLALSSFQASVRDFFVKGDGETKLVKELVDALDPSIFQDAERFAGLAAGPPQGMPPAGTGCFVHLGVEAFNDEDLKRLGKGYRAADACTLVAALDARRMAHDAYLIMSGPGTTLDDLASTLLTVSRLKIEHPNTFFLRIPVVPFVVPTYPSPSHAVWSRLIAKGRLQGEIEVERLLAVEGYDELSYPIVRRSLPADPDVRAACEEAGAIMQPDPGYFAPISNLSDLLRGRIETTGDPGRRARLRRTIRRLSGAPKRIVYEGIARARTGEIEEPVASRYWDAAARFGPAEEVTRELKNAMDVGDPRLVVIPTHDCSLRCAYCPMDKTDGLIMGEEVIEGAIELLMSSAAKNVILQFFGGEALIRREFVLEAMRLASAMAKEAGKHVGFILSTNGLSLDSELIDHLATLPVKIEISIDGPPGVHNRHRRPRDPGVDSHAMASRCAGRLIESKIPHEVIMVVTPATVGDLASSFDHVASLGFTKIQVNHALSMVWSTSHMETFARQLHLIETTHYEKSPAQNGAELVDLTTFRTPMLLNCEITVDHDGTIYFGNGFLVRTSDAAWFRAGHLSDLGNMDTYLAERPGNGDLIRHTYPADVARNNLEVGRVYASFVRHMRRRFPELARRTGVRSPGAGHPR